MSRECQADFRLLETYLSEYNLRGIYSNNINIYWIKRMHKRYFSIITINVELIYQRQLFISNYSTNDKIIDLLAESISDIGCSYFNWIHGSYKSSRIMLRVGIENFVRAISSIEDNTLLSEKNIYLLFKSAGATYLFSSNDEIKSLYLQLHSRYKYLCKDVHTSTHSNMQQINSLADFPKYEDCKAVECAKIFVQISNIFNTVFCLLFNEIFHSMHHRNKENVLLSTINKYKPILFNSNEENSIH